MKRQAFNPFLPLSEYIADGEVHVFGDRVYLYGSHDKEGGNTFCMLDYVVYSAPADDLSDWRFDGVSYCAKDDPQYGERVKYLYAPDVVRGNDGRYYLYYCMAGEKGQHGYENPISVAVSDSPAGKFRFIGFVRDQNGKPFTERVMFDPAVINDDGTIRIYSGTCYPFENFSNAITKKILLKIQARMFGKSAKEIERIGGVMGAYTFTLADDMLTINSEAVRIMPLKTKDTPFSEHAFYEGASIRKIGNVYYFIYSSVKNHELCYATSRFPDCDFRFGGTIVSNGDVGFKGRKEKDRLNTTGTTHGCIEQINGRWYVFYHRLTHNSDYSRQMCAERINIASDGSIGQVPITSCGLNDGPLAGNGVYPAAIACILTNGKMRHITNRKGKGGVPNIANRGEERYIADICNKTYIGFRYFCLKGCTKVRFWLRGTGRGKMYVTAEQCKQTKEVFIFPSEDWRIYETIIDKQAFTSLYFYFKGNGKIDFLQFELRER